MDALLGLRSRYFQASSGDFTRAASRLLKIATTSRPPARQKTPPN